ncbi:hypothetical protein HMPREF9944_01479 [Segatella maculosa OT 289]|uniref:Uncharacterized protein n=1 Tax=Segatella maculosa OT 289 TaxID=999422 RepID=H1HMT5_9BACT|nr:hypothetical protein HMPREF9944_01479 [Segatella maculosa OT 289]
MFKIQCSKSKSLHRRHGHFAAQHVPNGFAICMGLCAKLFCFFIISALQLENFSYICQT